MKLMRSRVMGYVLSAAGMAIGVAAGGYAGAAFADANRAGDLSDIGLGLIAIGAGGLLGGAAGALVLLLIARQPAALSTALLTMPLGVAGIVMASSLVDQIPRSSGGDFDPATTIYVQVIIVCVGLAVPLVARLLATRLSRQGPRPGGPTPGQS